MMKTKGLTKDEIIAILDREKKGIKTARYPAEETAKLLAKEHIRFTSQTRNIVENWFNDNNIIYEPKFLW